MSKRLKLTLLGLFILQLGVVGWAYFGQKFSSEKDYEAFGQYLNRADEITSLDLSDMNLKYLPKEVMQFKNLKYLNLSNNRFKTIPDEIYDLRKLRTIDLSHNRIKEVEFVKNGSIQRVILHHNKIEFVEYHPCNIGCLRHLEMIDLSYNRLEECPSFDEKSKLDTILLSHNQLNSFYNLHMSLPKKINYLDVSNNQIAGINENTVEFTGFDYNDLPILADRCKSLNISNNDFEYFPKEIFYSEKLDNLILQNATYNDGKMIEFSYSKIKTIDLSNSQSVPIKSESIENLKATESLNLSGSLLENLIIKNKRLQSLNLKDVPTVFTFTELQLPNLKHLSISYDKISSFSTEDFAGMPNLSTITIYDYPSNDEFLINQLEEIYPDTEISLK